MARFNMPRPSNGATGSANPTFSSSSFLSASAASAPAAAAGTTAGDGSAGRVCSPRVATSALTDLFNEKIPNKVQTTKCVQCITLTCSSDGFSDISFNVAFHQMLRLINAEC